MPLARLAWSIRQRTGPKPKVDFPSWNDIGNVHTLHKGALNVHVPIDFSDGERWACRARQQVLSRTAERVIMAHEIATSRELRTLVPEWIPDIFVPEVHQSELTGNTADLSGSRRPLLRQMGQWKPS